jgi:hypothetical protein
MGLRVLDAPSSFVFTENQYFFITRFSVGDQPWSTAFSNRFCAAAFLGVVDFDFIPFGVRTWTRPLPTDFVVIGIPKSLH